MPPLPEKSSGVLLERGARKLGLHPFPAPLAINSQHYRGRPACVHCGFCHGFACEVGAKASSLTTTIPEAEATGRCRSLGLAAPTVPDRQNVRGRRIIPPASLHLDKAHPRSSKFCFAKGNKYRKL